MISSNHVTMVCVWRMESHGQCLMSQDQCQGLSYNLKLMLPSDDEKLMNRLQEWISLLGATNKLEKSAMKTRHSEISWFSNLSTRDSVGHPNSQKQVPIDQACYVSFWMLDSHRTYIDQASDQSSWKCYGLSVCVCTVRVLTLILQISSDPQCQVAEEMALDDFPKTITLSSFFGFLEVPRAVPSAKSPKKPSHQRQLQPDLVGRCTVNERASPGVRPGQSGDIWGLKRQPWGHNWNSLEQLEPRWTKYNNNVSA